MSTEYGLMPYWGLARLLRVAPVSREMILNFVDRLPKTSNGKIQKNVIRSEHARHYQDQEG